MAASWTGNVHQWQRACLACTRKALGSTHSLRDRQEMSPRDAQTLDQVNSAWKRHPGCPRSSFSITGDSVTSPSPPASHSQPIFLPGSFLCPTSVYLLALNSFDFLSQWESICLVALDMPFGEIQFSTLEFQGFFVVVVVAPTNILHLCTKCRYSQNPLPVYLLI